MKAGAWAADPAPRGAGVLQVRKLTNGEAGFYYRYAAPDGERVRLPIAVGIELAEARRIAARLSVRYQGGDRDLRAVCTRSGARPNGQREVSKSEADAKAAHGGRPWFLTHCLYRALET